MIPLAWAVVALVIAVIAEATRDGTADDFLLTYFLLVFIGLPVILLGFGLYVATVAGRVAGKAARRVAGIEPKRDESRR